MSNPALQNPQLFDWPAQGAGTPPFIGPASLGSGISLPAAPGLETVNSPIVSPQGKILLWAPPNGPGVNPTFILMAVALSTTPGVANLAMTNTIVVPISNGNSIVGGSIQGPSVYETWANANYGSCLVRVNSTPGYSLFQDRPDIKTLLIGVNLTWLATGWDSTPKRYADNPLGLTGLWAQKPNGFCACCINVAELDDQDHVVAQSGPMYPNTNFVVVNPDISLYNGNLLADPAFIASLGRSPLFVSGQPANSPWYQLPKAYKFTGNSLTNTPPGPCWIGGMGQNFYLPSSGSYDPLSVVLGSGEFTAGGFLPAFAAFPGCMRVFGLWAYGQYETHYPLVSAFAPSYPVTQTFIPGYLGRNTYNRNAALGDLPSYCFAQFSMTGSKGYTLYLSGV